jgi:hypothetical protein
VAAPPSKFKKVAIAAPLSPSWFSPDMVGSFAAAAADGVYDGSSLPPTSSLLLDHDLGGFHPAFGQRPALRLIWLI